MNSGIASVEPARLRIEKVKELPLVMLAEIGTHAHMAQESP
jgi:hypothetical protein